MAFLFQNRAECQFSGMWNVWVLFFGLTTIEKAYFHTLNWVEVSSSRMLSKVRVWLKGHELHNHHFLGLRTVVMSHEQVITIHYTQSYVHQTVAQRTLLNIRCRSCHYTTIHGSCAIHFPGGKKKNLVLPSFTSKPWIHGIWVIWGHQMTNTLPETESLSWK